MARGEFNEFGTKITPVFAETNSHAFSGKQLFAKLKQQLSINPAFFETYDFYKLACILRAFNKCIPAEDERESVLVPLYRQIKKTLPNSIKASRFSIMARLMRAIQFDPALLEPAFTTPERREADLKRLHSIHAEVGNFKPDQIFVQFIACEFKDGSVFLIDGLHDRKEHAIIINNRAPGKDYNDAPCTLKPNFYKSIEKSAGSIFHEGCHTEQDYMDENDGRGQEFRDFASIMRLSAFGDYYFRSPTFSRETYSLNPTEQDAVRFQRYMTLFIKASPERRHVIIKAIEARRDRHLADAVLERIVSALPQPSLSLAA